MNNLLKKINNLRPTRAEVDKNREYCYAYVDAISDVVAIVKEHEKDIDLCDVNQLREELLSFFERRFNELRPYNIVAYEIIEEFFKDKEQ